MINFRANLKLNFKIVHNYYNMLINRQLKDEIIRLVEFYPVICVTGPRQSGKTTLCKNIFPEYSYFNLEDPMILATVRQDPKAFLDSNGRNMIIDEAHNFPELFSWIQASVDNDASRRFILSGSSNFLLLQNITQSLAGRAAIVTLLPLSLQELSDREPLSTDELLLKGGYPALWANEGFPRETFFQNYYATYIERDVRQIVNVKDLSLFQKFIGLCAGRIGCQFNASALSNEVGVSSVSISHWLSVLEASYIVYQLQPYYENIGKRLVKAPKLYFYDVGLACYLLGIENASQLSRHPLRGSIFENLVLNQAIMNSYNKGVRPNFFYYRDKSQNEVDVIKKNGEEISAFEIKSSQTFVKEYFKSIDYLKKIFGDRLTRSAIIYDGSAEIDTPEHGLYNFRSLVDGFTKI